MEAHTVKQCARVSQRKFCAMKPAASLANTLAGNAGKKQAQNRFWNIENRFRIVEERIAMHRRSDFFLPPLQKKLVCFIQARKRSLHIIQWWDVLTLHSVCISHCATRKWALTLFRNNHRACVLKRNTLELIIHWKRNTRIYSLCHLLCNQPGFLYISPVLDWLLEWIRSLDHWTWNFTGV